MRLQSMVLLVAGASLACGCEMVLATAESGESVQPSRAAAKPPRPAAPPAAAPRPAQNQSGATAPAPAAPEPKPEPPKDVKVPHTRSAALESAKQRIEYAGLKVGKVTHGVGPAFMAVGAVYKSEPDPNTVVKPGSSVDLYVKNAPKTASDGSPAVPHMWGMKIEDARKLLTDMGFTKIAVTETESSQKPHGTVMKHDPGAGESSRRNRHRPMKIEVAKRPMDADVPKNTKRKVPSVVGKTWNEAYVIMREAGGWRMKWKGERLTDETKIIGQDPKAGTMMKTFGIRKITVIFPEAPMITVPDVVGMTEKDAQSALRKAKFSTYSLGYSDKKVKSQMPKGGTKAKRGTRIRLTLDQ